MYAIVCCVDLHKNKNPHEIVGINILLESLRAIASKSSLADASLHSVVYKVNAIHSE
jgi:hypothetical protein